jgi:hypothetical protein
MNELMQGAHPLIVGFYYLMSSPKGVLGTVHRKSNGIIEQISKI